MKNKSFSSVIEKNRKRKNPSVLGMGSYVDWLFILIFVAVISLIAIFHSWRQFSYVSNRDFSAEIKNVESEFDPVKFERLLEIIDQKQSVQ